MQASSTQTSHEVRSRLPPTSPVRHPLVAAESAQDRHPRRHLSPHRMRGYSGQANGSPSRHASGPLRRSVSAYTLSFSTAASDNTGASRSENASPREHRSSADVSPRLGGSPALDPTALVLLKKKHPPRRRLRASSSAASPSLRHSPVIANEPVGWTAVQEPAVRQVKHGRRAGAHLSRSTSDTNLSSKLKLLYRSPTLQRATGQGGSGKSLRSQGSSSGGSANSILSIDSADSKQHTPNDELPSLAPRRGTLFACWGRSQWFTPLHNRVGKLAPVRVWVACPRAGWYFCRSYCSTGPHRSGYRNSSTPCRRQTCANRIISDQSASQAAL